MLNFKIILNSILCSFLLSSCGVYRTEFQCPPGKGIGCAAVGEVLDLIVEKEEGEDVFVKNKGQATILKAEEAEKFKSKRKSTKPRESNSLKLVRNDKGQLVLIPDKAEAK